MNFTTLINYLQHAHQTMQVRAGAAVNQSHTLRNWLFGYYIVEFEQNGQDYAEYGSRLLYRLADTLKKSGMKGISYTSLTLFRKFYLTYPQLGGQAADFLGLNDGEKFPIRILQPMAEEFSQQSLPAEKLISRLGFTHFVELMKVEEPVKRLFYEVECLKGSWTRRQLQRQIGTLLVVSKYMLQLPDEETLRRFLETERRNLLGE